MTKIAVISPHLDDAVFSLGATMLVLREECEFTIVTPFGCAPPGPYFEKYERLIAEHEAVCKVAGLKAINGPFHDDAARLRPIPIRVFDKWLNEVLADDFDEEWWPVGIHHPDHLDVSACIPLSQSSRWKRVSVYEELPYRVDYDAEVIEITGKELSTCQSGPPKDWLCRMYRSQVDDDVMSRLLVEERLWR